MSQTQVQSRLSNLITKKSFGRSITEAGIYENCSVKVDFVTAKSKVGNEYKKFNIEVTTADGESKIFGIMAPSRGFPKEVTLDNGTTRMQTDAEALQEAEDKVLMFPTTLVTLVDANGLADANSFEEIANLLSNRIADNNVKYSPTFNVKVTLDKEYKYTELGKYAESIFEIYKEGKPSKLKFGDKDRVTKPKEVNMFGDYSADVELAPSASDDLPF
jgi:hypothetical protein